MKRILAVLLLAFSASTMAAPVYISDGYVGGDDHGYGDVIGDVNKFGISGMTVDIVGNTLSVTINTLFGSNGLGTFAAYTYGNKGIGFGDLFLSSSGWNPNGAAPYTNDDHNNGTVWDYGIALSDHWNGASGASLYALSTGSGNTDVLLSQDFMSGATFRNDQEVAVDTSKGSLLGNTASFSGGASTVSFSLDLTGTALAGASNIGLHWGMTCGNDVIEGEYVRTPAPEPATIAIMLMGLGLVGFVGRRRRQVSI